MKACEEKYHPSLQNFAKTGFHNQCYSWWPNRFLMHTCPRYLANMAMIMYTRRTNFDCEKLWGRNHFHIWFSLSNWLLPCLFARFEDINKINKITTGIFHVPVYLLEIDIFNQMLILLPSGSTIFPLLLLSCFLLSRQCFIWQVVPEEDNNLHYHSGNTAINRQTKGVNRVTLRGSIFFCYLIYCTLQSDVIIAALCFISYYC